MNHSKNLFFSEDEIEAVDMEIETLLLARKRQESNQQPSSAPIITTLEPVKPLTESPVASRRSSEPTIPVVSFPVVRQQASALPPQREPKADTAPEHPAFHIVAGGEECLPWLETEFKKNQPRTHPRIRRYRLRFKWLIVLAMALLLWATLITAGYALWKSSNLLTFARFVFDLF